MGSPLVHLTQGRLSGSSGHKSTNYRGFSAFIHPPPNHHRRYARRLCILCVVLLTHEKK